MTNDVIRAMRYYSHTTSTLTQRHSASLPKWVEEALKKGKILLASYYVSSNLTIRHQS